MVVHDQQSPPAAPVRQPPAVREASATAPDVLLNGGGSGHPGDVVNATGGLFENYEVQRGDHIDAIARGFSTTPDVLIDTNHIRAPYRIRPGEIMKVPVAKAYVARGGDTLTGVARRFSVGVSELAQLNHVSERSPLHTGQQIGLPSSMRDRGAEYAENMPPSSSYMTPERPARSYPPSSTVHVPAETDLPARPSYGYVAPPPPSAAAQASTMSDSDIAQAAHGRFVWPVRGDMLARFGAQGVGRRNDGIDIRASQGTTVKAAASGEVVYAGNQVPGFGNLVLIKHADGWVTAYAHLDQVDVQMKQQVAQGQPLGSVGTSGGASEPELRHCAGLGIAFLPYSPLGGIRSAGQLGARHAAFQQVADAHSVSPQQVTLAWMLAKAPVVIPIPGASRPESITDSAGAAELTLSAAELEQLDRG